MGPPPIWDSEAINYLTSLVVQAKPEITEFIDGAIKDDYNDIEFGLRLEKIAKLLYTASGRNAKDLHIKFPLKDLSKYEVMKSIPGKLLKLTWSCRFPRIGLPYTYVPCHDCPPCNIIDKVLEEYPDEFAEFSGTLVLTSVKETDLKNIF